MIKTRIRVNPGNPKQILGSDCTEVEGQKGYEEGGGGMFEDCARVSVFTGH